MEAARKSCDRELKCITSEEQSLQKKVANSTGNPKDTKSKESSNEKTGGKAAGEDTKSQSSG